MSAENVFCSKENLLEGKYEVERSDYRLRLTGKYYFKPQMGGDRFYAGAYLAPRSLKLSGSEDAFGYDPGYKKSAISLGFVIGYKWVFANVFVFEVGVGGGHALVSKVKVNDPDSNPLTIERYGFDSIGVLALGFRLGK